MLRRNRNLKPKFFVHASDIVDSGGFLGHAIEHSTREIFGCVGKCGVETGRINDRALFFVLPWL